MRIERWAGGCSLVAGVLHGVAGPAHFEAWWGYGLFFVFAAAAQFLFGLALLTKAINPKDYGPGWRAAKRGLLWTGLVGNVLIVLFYALTRTVGIPLGPDRGLVEGVGALDAASKLAEAATIILVAVILARMRRQPQQS